VLRGNIDCLAGKQGKSRKNTERQLAVMEDESLLSTRLALSV
jgi:hypothetical protein